MQVVVFLLNIVSVVVAPLKRAYQAKQNAHRDFYKQGLMTQEIEALQSNFSPKSAPPTRKSK